MPAFELKLGLGLNRGFHRRLVGLIPVPDGSHLIDEVLVAFSASEASLERVSGRRVPVSFGPVAGAVVARRAVDHAAARVVLQLGVEIGLLRVVLGAVQHPGGYF